MPHRRFRSLICAAAAAAGTMICATADGANKTWIGGAIGSWSVGANWNLAGQPITNDNPFLIQADAINRTVVFDAAANVGTFGVITLNATGAGSITLSKAVSSLFTNNIIAGAFVGGTGQVVLTAGTFSAGSATFGDLGDGLLLINGGARVDLGNTANFGLQAGAAGTFVMSAGSFTVGTMNFGGALDAVSNDGVGFGSFSGGSMSVANVMRIGAGDNSTSDGTFNISGGTLSTGTLVVGTGTQSSGTMNFTGGRITINSAVLMATGNSSSASLFQSDGTFAAASRPMTIGVGQNSVGTFALSGTGFCQVSTLTLGAGTGSVGTLVLNGGTFNASRVIVGTSGTGNVDHNPLGSFIVSGTLSVGAGTSGVGSYVMSGGTLTTGALVLGQSGGNGTFAMFGGAASVTLNSSTFGTSSGTGTLQIFNSASIGFEGSLTIGGSSGTGYARIGGGTFQVGVDNFFEDDLFVGFGTGGVGMVEQNGGRVIVSGQIQVGQTGAVGTYSISGGQTNASDMTLGIGNSGTLLVSGGTLQIGGLNVGNSSNTSSPHAGFVRQTGGLISCSGQLTLGANPGNSGVVLLSGGTFLGSGVSVGFQDSAGTLTINNGAFADFSGGISIDGDGVGFVSVTNATLEASGISVGDGGTFTFNSGQLRLTSGTMNVGPTPGSLLGRLVVLNAARQLGVTGTIAIASNGVMQLDGGLLSIGTLTIAPGGLLVHNSGTLNFTGMNVQIGSGTLSPLGTLVTLPTNRALTFTSARTPTILSDGLLDVTGGYFDGGGTLIVNAGGQARVSPTGGYLTAIRLSNSGRLDVSGGRAQFDGVLSAPGEIVLANSSVIAATGSFTTGGLLRGDGLVQAATFTNAAAGRIRSSDSETMRILSSSAPINNGTIDLLGGAVDFGGSALSNTGRITGRGQLMAGSINNTGTMTFSSGTSDVIAFMENSSAGKTIVTGGGNATFHGPVSNTGTSEFRVSTNSIATFLGPVNGLSQFTGPGTKIFEDVASFGRINTAGGNTIVGPAGNVVAEHIRESGLSIEGVFAVAPDSSNNGASRLNQLQIAGAIGAWDGTFDLASNALVIDYEGPSPRNTIADQLQSGFAGGAWNGTGIRSSTAATTPNRAIGIAEASDIGSPVTFAGQSVDGTSVLLRLTIPGDANLDKIVDIGDFALLAANFNTTSYWPRGDFNFDNLTDIGDFALLAANFNQSAPAFENSRAVPEPGVIPFATVAAALRFRRLRYSAHR